VGTPLLSSAADGGMGLASRAAFSALPLAALGVVVGMLLWLQLPTGGALEWIPALGISLAWRIDGLAVLLLALAIFGVRGSADAGMLAVGVPLLVIGLVPLVGMVWLRLAPGQVVAVARAGLRVTTGGRGADSVEYVIRRIADGLGSLQGGRHLWWVTWHSIVIWTVLGVAPFLIAMASLGIDLGSLARELAAGFVTLAAVGVAVALPSAPGFLGPYHLAAREALRRFGVTEELALAVGTLSHALFWVTSTGVGLAVLRFRGTRLDELAQAGADEHQVRSEDRR